MVKCLPEEACRYVYTCDDDGLVTSITDLNDNCMTYTACQAGTLEGFFAKADSNKAKLKLKDLPLEIQMIFKAGIKEEIEKLNERQELTGLCIYFN